MWYIGVDAHKRDCFLTAKDKEGRLRDRRMFPHTREGWTQAFLGAPKGSKVAIECVGWYQHVFVLLEKLGFQPVLVHARGVALIAKSKKKTDRNDSEVLCDLLRAGYLPTSYVPTPAMRELRELTRHLDRLTKEVVRVKNQVQRILERAWIETPNVSDLFGLEGRRFLESTPVSPSQRVVLSVLLKELDTLEANRNVITREIAVRVENDEDVDLLTDIDGLSVIGAATLKAEIDDVNRFKNRKAIRSNFGVATAVRASADAIHRGHITKQGPGVVRKILVQGSWAFERSNPDAKAKHAHLTCRRGRGIARMATAGDLLDVIYQVLKTRQRYRHARPRLAAQKRRLLHRLAHEAKTTCVS